MNSLLVIISIWLVIIYNFAEFFDRKCSSTPVDEEMEKYRYFQEVHEALLERFRKLGYCLYVHLLLNMMYL